MVHQISDMHRRESHAWSNTVDLLLVCDKPFAAICIADDQQYPSQSGYRRDCVRVAQQALNDELFRTFNPVDLESIETNLKIGEKPVRYVRLTDVATAIVMEPIKCLRAFAPVSPSSYYEPNAAIWSAAGRFRIYETVPKDGDCSGATQWGYDTTDWKVLQRNIDLKKWPIDKIFIPMAWARDILILSRFGFIPGEQETPTPSFEIRTQQPEPYTCYGLLPVKPIDEIRELRGFIPSERTPGEWVSLVNQSLGREKRIEIHERMDRRGRYQMDRARSAFECWVETLTGHDDWAPAQELNDTGSFVYHDDFRILRLFDGRLTIATSFWSRGGEGNGQYWAGFIAVHRQITVDPRREPALYRLMIWPNQILRQTPIGAVGGFFPEIDGIEPEIMETIRAIIDPLGFVEMT